jgi:hypothetical protein
MIRKTSIFLALCALTACGVITQTSYDENVDFGKYKTFCWLKGCEFTVTGPHYLSDNAIRAGVKRSIMTEMEKRGIQYNDANPDLLVDFHITLREETSYIYHRKEDEPFYYSPLPETEKITYLDGTIIIDLADRNEGRMVWRSVAKGYMDAHPELTEKNLHRGIRKALKSFPPKSHK